MYVWPTCVDAVFVVSAFGRTLGAVPLFFILLCSVENVGSWGGGRGAAGV